MSEGGGKMRWRTVCQLFILFVWGIGCTSDRRIEQNRLPEIVTPPLSTTTPFAYSEESIAKAMMLAYPEDSTIEYIVVDEKSSADGSEIKFEFIDISREEIANLSLTGWDDVTSPNGVFRAFVACEYENCAPRLFVENMIDAQIFEITFSMRMPWRPLSNLTWLDNNILAFSQSSNPHYGFRYAIEVKQRNHLLTLVLADECYRTGKCDGER